MFVCLFCSVQLRNRISQRSHPVKETLRQLQREWSNAIIRHSAGENHSEPHGRVLFRMRVLESLLPRPKAEYSCDCRVVFPCSIIPTSTCVTCSHAPCCCHNPCSFHCSCHKCLVLELCMWSRSILGLGYLLVFVGSRVMLFE